MNIEKFLKILSEIKDKFKWAVILDNIDDNFITSIRAVNNDNSKGLSVLQVVALNENKKSQDDITAATELGLSENTMSDIFFACDNDSYGLTQKEMILRNIILETLGIETEEGSFTLDEYYNAETFQEQNKE